MPETGFAKGKCPKCGKTFAGRLQGDIIICDCWEYCPLCGAKMEPYTPDLTPNVYGLDGKCDFQILMVCKNNANHWNKSPFYSTQKPIEVILT